MPQDYFIWCDLDIMGELCGASTADAWGLQPLPEFTIVTVGCQVHPIDRGC
jgi:hypothetical protein